MTHLEQAAIAFFRALRGTGKKQFGHDQFGFKINIETMAPVEDKDAATAFNANVQEALTLASRTVQPVIIEGTTLQ